MKPLLRAWRQHLRIVQCYPAAALVVLAVFLLVIFLGWDNHSLVHAIGYLFAVWLGALVTDMVVELKPQTAVGFPIKGSAANEVGVILGCTLLGMVPLIVSVSGLWRMLHGLYRLPIVALLLFTFPIVLALIYLFYFKYRLRELGINAHYWYLALLIHLIVGGITLTVAPEQSHWHRTIQAWGWIGVLVTGFLGAALSEEFLRMLLQTRLGSVLKNKGVGFVLATFLWAAMHIPVGIRDAHSSNTALWHIWIGVWGIMPMGLLWGYMTHRTRSLLPAVLVHGLNFWGLQN